MRFSVLLPCSLVGDAPSLLQKTVKIGLVGRILAVFRVEKVVLYNDGHPSCKKDADLIMTLLRYLETPQYLRKILFPPDSRLRYAGVLPPLRTPHHPLRGEKEEVGSIREAAVIKVEKEGSVLELGMSQKGFLAEKLRQGQRVTVKIVEKKKDKVLVERASPPDYWGFKLEKRANLDEALDAIRGDLIVGTSRYGKPFMDVQSKLVEEARKKEGVGLVFGGPYGGLFEICSSQGVDISRFDFVVNVIPNQGTATVRTEEALLATLAILNVMFS